MSYRQTFALGTHDRAGLVVALSFSTAASDPFVTPDSVSDPGGMIGEWLYADGEDFVFSLVGIGASHYASRKFVVRVDGGARVVGYEYIDGGPDKDGVMMIALDGDYSAASYTVAIMIILSDFK